MKKTLVLAMAMALGVSATAFAANPFSDVPAGHWAYASVAKLAAAGVVDGYPDGTFKGNNLMTRYEMAQIVAKALAKGAIGSDDKLVGEFADELDNLGVRVAKLEKNSDNVKITGNIRATYADYAGSTDPKPTSYSKIRTRLFLSGEVNDNFRYVSMLQNEQNLNNGSGDETTRFQRAYLTGKIGQVGVTAGRFEGFIAEGNVYDNRVDAVQLTAGKTVKVTAEVGRMSSNNGTVETVTTAGVAGGTGTAAAGKYYRIGLGGNVGKVALEANYVKADEVYTLANTDDKIYTFGANYTTGDLTVGAMYLKGSSDYTDALDMSDKGYVISLAYGTAKANKVGSLGAWAKYYNQGASTVIAHTMNGAYLGQYGLKGYGIGVDYTVAKNMVAGIQYFDLKDKDLGDAKHKTLWSQLIVTF
jgi:hypothetical protein